MNLRFAAVGALLLLIASAPAAETPSAPVDPAKPPPHRPLRSNVVPETPPAPTEPTTFSGYADAPPFKVVPQKDKLTFYPCSQCHQFMQPNPQPRKLEAAPHPAALQHGGGRMWCLNCHLIDNRDFLRTLKDQKVDFDESYLLCGQCHFNRQKDWYLGGHGKRVYNWQGERMIYSCTHCHDPHDPTLKPRAPSKTPPVRVGLERMKPAERESQKVWERHAGKQTEAADAQ
ncbi:MAG TPA: cytochrome C [Burkholderiales bacterium]|nr:cytochrome C [Burkholderiales bacterium]